MSFSTETATTIYSNITSSFINAFLTFRIRTFFPTEANLLLQLHYYYYYYNYYFFYQKKTASSGHNCSCCSQRRRDFVFVAYFYCCCCCCGIFFYLLMTTKMQRWRVEQAGNVTSIRSRLGASNNQNYSFSCLSLRLLPDPLLFVMRMTMMMMMMMMILDSSAEINSTATGDLMVIEMLMCFSRLTRSPFLSFSRSIRVRDSPPSFPPPIF